MKVSYAHVSDKHLMFILLSSLWTHEPLQLWPHHPCRRAQSTTFNPERVGPKQSNPRMIECQFITPTIGVNSGPKHTRLRVQINTSNPIVLPISLHFFQLINMAQTIYKLLNYT